MPARADGPEAPPAPGVGPALNVGLELARAVLGLALLPARLAGDLVRRGARRRELCARLGAESPLRPERAAAWPVGRPLRVLISCAESSGEIHGASVLAALRRQLAELGAEPPEVLALGGARLEAAGVELLARPVERASMGFSSATRALPYWLGLLHDAASHLARHRPDVLLAVDSPALHVPLARIARRYGVPAVHFVAPQYWGWAPWRVRAYRRAIERALTILPFEAGWFARHGVRVEHVGHPLLDALEGVPATRPAHDARALVLLPGSREGTIRRNLPWMLAALERARPRLPGAMVQVLQEDAAPAALCRELIAAARPKGPVEVLEGPIHAHLSRARAAFSVSGTVGLDLLHHRLPGVVVYRLDRRIDWARRRLLISPWFASVNLLARRELCPEFAFAGEGPVEAVGRALERCYGDSTWRAECIEGLDEVALRLGPPGAAERAAAATLEVAAARRSARGR